MSATRRLCGLLFVFTGTLHFVIPRRYEAIMPPRFPAHSELVLVSGAAEVVGGLGVLTPGLERASRWWLIAVLIAIFPANVHMARNPDQIKGLPPIPRWLLWARLPFQGAFIALVVRATRREG